MSEKRASTDYPIHKLLAERWSPYTLKGRHWSNLYSAASGKILQRWY